MLYIYIYIYTPFQLPLVEGGPLGVLFVQPALLIIIIFILLLLSL